MAVVACTIFAPHHDVHLVKMIILLLLHFNWAILALGLTPRNSPLFLGGRVSSSSTQTRFSAYECGDPLEDKYHPYTFQQPLDHFDDENNHTYQQRYWVDKRFYQPGGPVFVLDGGEANGACRLPTMDTGILAM